MHGPFGQVHLYLGLSQETGFFSGKCFCGSAPLPFNDSVITGLYNQHRVTEGVKAVIALNSSLVGTADYV